jgi:hypothetical protein
MNFVFAIFVPPMTDSHISPQVGGLRGSSSYPPPGNPFPQDNDRQVVSVNANFFSCGDSASNIVNNAEGGEGSQPGLPIGGKCTGAASQAVRI